MSGLVDSLQQCQRMARETWFPLLEGDGVYPPVDVAAVLWRQLLHESSDGWTLEDGWSDPSATLGTFREYLGPRADDLYARWVVFGRSLRAEGRPGGL